MPGQSAANRPAYSYTHPVYAYTHGNTHPVYAYSYVHACPAHVCAHADPYAHTRRRR